MQRTSWCTVAVMAALFGPGLPPAAAAHDELGRPPVRLFRAEDYNGNAQNWGVAQGPDGLIWVANTSFLLRFDGERWTRLPMPNASIVRSVAVGDDGTVWVGAVGELGAVVVREDSELAFVSLLDRLPADERDFSDVWRCFAVPGGAVFWVGDRLLIWRDDRFTVRRVASARLPWLIGNSLLVNLAGEGLHRLEGGELAPVDGGEATAGLEIMVMLPHPEGGLLLGTRSSELYLLAADATGDVALTPWHTEVDDQLAAARLYHGAVTANGEIVLTTALGGCFVLDGDGRLMLRLDRREGLPDRSAWYAFVDREHGLWLALNNGLARFEQLSGLGVFDERTGLEGTVETIARHAGTLYAGTSSGLFALQERGFRRIPGVAAPCWTVVEAADAGGSPALLAGTFAGVFEVDGGLGRNVLPGSNVYAIEASRRFPGVYLLGSMHGLTVARREEGGGWRPLGQVSGIDREARSLAQEEDGTIWVGTLIDGVARVRLGPGGDPATAVVELIGLEQGLPSRRSVKVAVVDGDVLLGSPDGIFGWQEGRGVEPDERLPGTRFAVLRLVGTADGDLWLSRSEEDPAVVRGWPGGSPTLEPVPLRLPRVEPVLALWPESGGVAWFGSSSGLRRWQPSRMLPGPPPHAPRIGSLRSSVGRVRPDGPWPEAGGPDPSLTGKRRQGRSGLSLPFAENDLTFEFSAVRFSDVAGPAYRSRLDGLEEDWSEWTRDSRRIFTNLREGRYAFRVQSRDHRGVESPEGVFRFVIRPPWYRHPVAVGLYLGLTVLGLLGVVRLRARALENENLRLEGVIAERTLQLSRRARELEAARSELEVFSYSVSHDLQAPLRRIESFGQLLEEDLGPRLAAGERQLVERIRANCREMSELIAALLRLSRLGRAEVVPVDVDLGAMAREVLATLATGAPQRRFWWSVDDGLVVHADPTLLRVVVTNLLENAVKFTARQEEARIEVRRQEAPDRPGQIVVAFADNGVGFDPVYADKLFAPFARLHSEADFPGAGIGLATVRRLLHRQDGEIWAESRPDKGAVFHVSLPTPSVFGEPDSRGESGCRDALVRSAPAGGSRSPGRGRARARVPARASARPRRTRRRSPGRPPGRRRGPPRRSPAPGCRRPSRARNRRRP